MMYFEAIKVMLVYLPY